MFDNGNHVVLRRDGVAVVLKTPQNEMPQVDTGAAISACLAPRASFPRSTR